LRRNRFRLRGSGHVEIIPTPPKIDDTVVVRVLENADEHSFIEAFAVATEQLVRSGTNRARADRGITLGQGRDRATNDIECLRAREPLACSTNRIGGFLPR